MTFDYARYLAAKTTVDDRALNRQVLADFSAVIAAYESGLVHLTLTGDDDPRGL